MFHTFMYLPHNKSSYDNYNFFQNETLCHTFHNTIPENMVHVMKMMNIKCIHNHDFDRNNNHHDHNHNKNYHNIKTFQ